MYNQISTGQLNTSRIQGFSNQDSNVYGYLFNDDNTINNDVDRPSLKISGGISAMRINRIHNNGGDLDINGFIFSGGGPPSSAVNKENVNILNINAYTGIDPLNDKLHILPKLYANDGIYLGNTTSVLANNNNNLTLFKTNGGNVHIDTEGEILFQTNSTSGRVFPDDIVSAITRMKIDSTNITAYLPLETPSITTDTINEKTSNNGVLIDGTLIKNNSLPSISSVISTSITTNTINGTSNSTVINGNTLTNSYITIPTELRTDTIVPIGASITIAGVNINNGSLSIPSTFSATSLTTNNINSTLTNINISGISVHAGVITGASSLTSGIVNTTTINTTNIGSAITLAGPVMTSTGTIISNIMKANSGINTDLINELTLNAGVTIEDVLVKDGNVIYDSTNIKDPCMYASTSDLTLVGIENVDGIDVADQDRILVKDQADPNQNGIWIVNAAGAWTRAPNTNNMLGVLILVISGSTQAGTLWTVSAINPIVFSQVSGGSTPGPGGDHWTLTHLQGGTTNQYYHINSAQYSKVSPWLNSANTILTTDGDLTNRDINVSRDLYTDSIKGKTSATTLNMLAKLAVTNNSGDITFNIPTGNTYNFSIDGAIKLKVIENSIMTDHIYGIDKEKGTVLMNSMEVENNGNTIMNVNPSGLHTTLNTYKNNTTSSSWIINSDVRIKKDIKKTNPYQSFHFINNIDVMLFRYKKQDDETLNIGIIANELEEKFNNSFSETGIRSPILTEKLRKIDDKEYENFKNYDPSSIIYHLINSIKVLNERIALLEGKLE